MNLETIARLSGVSRSTVSRVINQSPNVSQQVRERVLQVIRETNFQPNLAARSLASASTHILGLVIPQPVGQFFVDPYFPMLIQGVTAACNVRDYSVMLWLAEPEYERRTIRQVLHSGLIDGVIISSMPKDDPLIDALLENNFPFVMVGRSFTDKPIHFIDVDNVEGAHRAVMHLIGQDRKRIAIINGTETIISGTDRLTGYKMALEQARLPWEDGLVENGDFTLEGGYHAMQRLIACHPDAVFVASDSMAQGAYRAILEAGLRIPQDIAIVGFDDMPFAAHMQPPLTTIRQPVHRMGSTAADTLIDLINNPHLTQPHQIVLPTELVVRISCGAYSF